MDKRTDKKLVDPVIDQQIIKQKKGKGIWWLLLAIIIIILAIWFSTQRNNNDAAPAPSSSPSAGAAYRLRSHDGRAARRSSAPD